MAFIIPFDRKEIDGICESEGQRMLELLDEANPRVSDIRYANDFVGLINRCIATIESEAGVETHRGALTFVAMQWRDSIGRMSRPGQ